MNIAREYGLGSNGGRSEQAMASSPNTLRLLSGKPAGNHSSVGLGSVESSVTRDRDAAATGASGSDAPDVEVYVLRVPSRKHTNPTVDVIFFL